MKLGVGPGPDRNPKENYQAKHKAKEICRIMQKPTLEDHENPILASFHRV